MEDCAAKWESWSMRGIWKEIWNVNTTKMPTIKKTVRRPWQKVKEPFGGRRHPNRKFYESSAWRALRAKFIAANPLCVECKKRGVITPAQVVDHIVPINLGGAPLSEENLQPLCHKCHNAKSATDKIKWDGWKYIINETKQQGEGKGTACWMQEKRSQNKSVRLAKRQEHSGADKPRKGNKNGINRKC